MNCGSNNWIEKGGLSHVTDMSPQEHSKFVEAFRIFKEKSKFDEEVSPMMLKYYVQMAFLEGWKRKQVINEG
jgi:hypothetical protein